MSKDSIRKKIDEAKANVAKTLASGNVSPESKALIDTLLMIIEILVAVFLEKKTRKDSSNSGLPPSLNNGSNGNRNQGSGKRGSLGSELNNLKHTESLKTVSPLYCTDCEADLSNTKIHGKEERKEIDISYEIITHTVVAEVKKCHECGKLNKGEFPKGMDGPVQYGDGIKSAIINYMVIQMMSLQRIQEHMMGLIGRAISQAVMLKYLLHLSAALKEWEIRSIEKILKSKAINCDETGIRINKENWWLHTYGSGTITLQFLHRLRGSEAMDEIGIIPRYSGVLVHDCWSSYFSYVKNEHGLCGSHLLRELKFIEDSCRYTWATELKKTLISALESVNSKIDSQVLSTEEYAAVKLKYRQILSDGLAEMPLFPGASGKPGKAKKTDAQNLWERFFIYEDSVLLFARNKHVSFTNNRAERDLRMARVKIKVAGCFRTSEMAMAFYRVSSYLKSMKYQGYSANQAIILALKGQIPN